jgi:hypothetical protein
MNNDRALAEQMKFLFISNPNTFATYTFGIPLKSCVYILITWLILHGFTLSVVSDMFNIAVGEAIIWLVMLAGPLTENCYLCWALTIIIQIITIPEVCFKLFIALIIILKNHNVESAGIVLALLMHVFLWLLTVYVYFSYTKSLGLGLLPNQVSQDNSQCLAFIRSNCQVPATSLRVDERPTIVLTNPNDLVFIGDKQGLTVSGTTLPSGLVVPSRIGKLLEIVLL